MARKTFILLTAIVIILLISCKKEGPQGPAGPTGPTGISTTPDPAIYGKWEVISGLPSTRYIILKNDNFLYKLDSTQYGFRYLSSDLAFITSVQIRVFWLTYNYFVTGDTLRMINNTDSIVLKKNSSAPDETSWVTMVTVTDTIYNPVVGGDGRQDIGFDGANILWAGEWNTSTLYKINPASATHTTLSLTGSYYSPSTNYASFSIWIVNNTTIDKINPTTGAVLQTSPALCSQRVKSLALIGQKMYYSSDGYLYTWDISTDEILQHFPYDADGMEYTGGYLYLLKEHQIHKCQLSPFKCVLTYQIESPFSGGNIGGLTYDGTHFWIVGEDPDNYEYALLKLSI
ncbi:MAG TPA: hypothetical protein PKN48_09260 [Bacteroidales bacterium]|nr:hypothetical protein [Bacteroidales bacterium]